ncbi:MAG TPA: argininosuccinate lyase [Acidobacteriaceae bacterium]
MKMWSGRFREPLDPDFEDWQRSFVFDWQLLPQETAASQAHAFALAAAGILSAAELKQIVDALVAIREENAGLTDLAARSEAEDIHHFVELELVARIGELGLKLHTGRSRNEQIATDLRLYVREKSAAIIALLASWSKELLKQARTSDGAAMPAYTHLQRAEPVLVAHWLQAYVEMLLRDMARLRDLSARLNYCPLGSGAVAGATLKLDRTIAAEELGFTAPTANSMDATSDRDFALEFLQALSVAALHASRFAEEITLYATAEFGFIRLPERFSTGSSAMPQKKNPDLTELVRAKVGRIHGAAQSVTMVLKGLPLAYNKDLQETQEPIFSAADSAERMFRLLGMFTAALEFNFDRMRAACETGYLNAMAAATYLVHKGLPFRKAHERVGQAVRYGLETERELGDLTLEELRRFAPEFDTDFFSSITLEATLNCHDVVGGTAIARVHEALAEQEKRIASLSGAPLSEKTEQEDLGEQVHTGLIQTGQIHGNS